MDDALLQSLPDDPAALKRLVVELTQRRDVKIAALEAERDRRIAELERKQQEWEQARQQMELEKLRLAHQLELLRKRYYGPRADRVEPNQLLLEFAVALEARPVDAGLLATSSDASPAPPGAQESIDPQTIRRVRRAGGRRDLTLFDKLPTTRQVHDLSDEQKPCPCCHAMRKPIGQETSWQIEYLPARFQRIEHVRMKYVCPTCEPNGDNPQIALADKPASAAPIEKGMAGPGLLAYVVTSKFSDFLPLYRLENIFARNGFEIDRSTMCVWVGDVADLVRPLYDRMVQRVLSSHVIHTDDTVMPMLAPEKTKQARMWVYVGDDDHPYQVFDFTLITSASVSQWLAGSITAEAITTLKTTGDKKTALRGDFKADVTLATPLKATPGAGATKSLSTFSVAGFLDGAVISTNSDISTVSLGGIKDSSILVAVKDTVVGLPTAVSDFIVASDATIGSLTIKGIKTEVLNTKFTVNSIIAALRFSKVTLKDIDPASGSGPWGVVADKINSFARTPKKSNDPKITSKSPDETLITDGNFRLTLVA